jgi:Na+-transporting NADH:ubiquinone oxidoreductase subunit NqrB
MYLKTIFCLFKRCCNELEKIMIWVIIVFIFGLGLIFMLDWDKIAYNIAKWLDDDNTDKKR